MAGLFDTFNIAKRGLYVQQSAINTTSHNIANANTEGYSRQRSVAETTKPSGATSLYETSRAGQVGTGAEITSIQRIRDSFIDYQVRSEKGTSGYYTTASETLSKVEDIFGEPSDTGIQELVSKFYSAFQEVSKTPDKSDVKTVAIKKASALADAINYAYNQLKKTNEDTQKILQTNVTDVNSYLNQVNELNKQIREVSAVGQTPNDLMDKRDNLIDKLSSKFGISIDRDKFETINLSSTEYPDAALVKSNPNDTNYSRLSYVKSATAVNDGTVTVEYYPLGNENAVTKTFTIASDGTTNAVSNAKKLADSLMQNRVLIGDKDGTVNIKATATKATASIPGTASAGISIGSGVNVTTTAAVNGDLTIAFDTTPAISITRNASGAIGNASGVYATTNNSDGTMDIKLNPNNVTIQIGKDGSISVPAEHAKNTTQLQLEKSEFQTYKYVSEVNNVDNNHIKGEIASNQSVQENIKGYMESLDRLAAGLAYSVNAIQTGSITNGTTTQGLADKLIFVNNGSATKTDAGITAATIKVNSDLVSDPTKLNCNTTSASGVGDGKRAAAIANLNALKMNLSNVTLGEDLTQMTRNGFLTAIGVTGFSDAATASLSLTSGTDGSTIDTYYKTIINNLAVTTQEAGRISDNQGSILANLEDQKAEVSGVSIDEEMTNLIQYQHAYQANAKIISTINDLLDVVINGLMR